MPRPIIASAADAGYFPLLIDLLDSLDEAGVDGDIARGVVDLGLRDDQRRILLDRGTVLVPLLGQCRLRLPETVERRQMGTLIRPFYPDLFPDHDPIVHMDSDTYVQAPDALDGYIAAARAGKLAIVAESEPSYVNTGFNARWRWERLAAYYGACTAQKVLDHTYYNAGIFALARNSPLWALLATEFQAAIDRSGQPFFSDQTVLNYIIWQHRPAMHALPATCNWLSHLALPMLDPERAEWLHPFRPHTRLKVIHVAVDEKLAPRSVRLRGGGCAPVALTRSGVRDWCARYQRIAREGRLNRLLFVARASVGALFTRAR